MNLNKVILAVVAFIFLAVSVPGVALSQDAQSSLALYFWGASIGGNTVRGNDIDIDLDDILDDLEMVFMGNYEFRKGKWFLMTDAVYLNTKNEKTIAGVGLSAEVSSWIVTPAVGFNVVDSEGFQFDILGGARYLYLKTDLRAGSRAQEESGGMWDGLIGIKGRINLGENFYIPYYGDVGTGDTDLSWQAYGGIGFRFERIDLELGYRYLDLEFDDRVVESLNFSGPLAGIRFNF